ncbi:MAG TPA: VPLPA-CTERM sorting domain-containing protein [Spongiibacteraceae bacterium]|nr:VPLPA-CTERM sorting domain-containing protein [Spongiibacteraceae bacterium]
MKMNSPKKISIFLKACSAGVALTSMAFSVSAAPTPYANTGTENLSEYTFTAATTGDIIAYFFGKGGAIFENTLGMTVNGVATGSVGLNNQSSSEGDALNLGFANAGDTIVFTLNVADTGNIWSSTKSSNFDGVNHVYSSAFSAEELIPAGVYVAFEDLALFGTPNSDFNYTDEQFVVTNVTGTTDNPTPAVPLPTAAWLFGSGLLGMAGVTRGRSKAA